MFRFISTLAIATTALLLAGCYTSRTLLLDSYAAASPLSSGVYARGSDRYYLSQQSGGWYHAQYYVKGSPGPAQRLLLNRAYGLEGGSRTVYYYAAEDDDVDWAYGLLVIDGGAVYRLEPDCEFNPAVSIATSEGAEYYEDEFGAECMFKDVHSLKRALDRYYSTANWGSPFYRE